MIKKILNSLLTFFIIILVGTLVITILNYFNMLSNSIISIIKLILPILGMFISSYRLGKTSEKKGYLEGLKFGGIVILTFSLLVILLDKFELKSLIYYLILILTSIMSSTVGINRKKTN